MTRTLAVDYGLKRIGLALSDPMGIIASPLTTVEAAGKLDHTVDRFLEAISEHEISKIVVGIPYRMNGEVGLQADEVKHFIDKLQKKTEIPIVLWDERLTTVQAERAMREASMSRKKRSKVVDKVAAVIILQSYLEAEGCLPV